MAGSKAIHQTSPRLGGSAGVTVGVPDQTVGPFLGVPLAHLVGGHVLVALVQGVLGDMRSGQIVEKPTDAARADAGVKALVDVLIDGDGELPNHPHSLYV